MAYKRYLLALIFRSLFLFISLFTLAGAILLLDFKTKLPVAIVSISPIIFVVVYAFLNLYKFVIRRFVEMDDFFEKVLDLLLAAFPRIDTAAIILFDEEKSVLGKGYSRLRKNPEKKPHSYSEKVVMKVINIFYNPAFS